MGGSSISSSDMHSYYSSRSDVREATHASQVFKESRMRDEFNPAKMKLPREACDSALSPHSRGIIFAEDILAFIIIFTVCAVLFVSKTKEENELIECVKRLLTQ